MTPVAGAILSNLSPHPAAMFFARFLRPVIAAATLAFAPAQVFAQAPSPPEEPPPTVWRDGSEVVMTSENSVIGRTYFAEMSDDLVNWQYMAWMDIGGANPIDARFNITGNARTWLRFRMTDSAAANADFDADGLGGYAEVMTWNTDPFDPDTDDDYLPDGWETRHGFDPTSDAPGGNTAGDPDGDTLTNLREYQLGTNPKLADSDEDGLPDKDEVRDGTDAARFDMPVFTIVSSWRSAKVTESVSRQNGNPWLHRKGAEGLGGGTAGGARSRDIDPAEITRPSTWTWTRWDLKPAADEVWGNFSQIPPPLVPVEAHDKSKPLAAFRIEDMHGTGGFLPAAPGNPNRMDCRDVSRSGYLLERTVRLQASRVMKVGWTVPYLLSRTSQTTREGPWSTPEETRGVFTFTAGQQYSDSVIMNASSTKGTAPLVPASTRLASPPGSPWRDTLFTQSRAVEWITLTKRPVPPLPFPALDKDGDGVPNALEIRMGTNENNRNSDNDGYGDGDQLNSGVLPAADGLFVSSRKVKYVLDPVDPDCPYHPANRLILETDVPAERAVRENEALPDALGVDEPFQSAMNGLLAFPNTPPASPAVPDPEGTPSDPRSSAPAAAMDYTRIMDAVGDPEVYTAAGTQRRVWARVAEPVTRDTELHYLKLRTVKLDTGAPVTTASRVTLHIDEGDTESRDYAELMAKRTPGSAVATAVNEGIKKIQIVPDTGVAGVLGASIASSRGAGGEKHFVSPKKHAGLPGDYLTFKAENVSAADFQSQLQWEGGEPVAGSPLLVKVKRDTTGKKVVTVKLKTGGQEVARLNVWVVWWSVVATKQFPYEPEVQYVDRRTRARMNANWSFEASCDPVAILDNVPDIPDLMGASNTKAPNYSNYHAHDGKPMGTPLFKWDLTRQWRERSLVPTLTAADLGWPEGGLLLRTLPNANIIQVTSYPQGPDGYPSEELEGNDDGGDDRNPYTPPHVLRENDNPTEQPRNSAGSLGDTVETRSQFRCFVRVALGSKWYRVSDYAPWRFHAKFIKVSERLHSIDYDGNGTMLDNLWIDNGAVSDATNNGW